LIRYRLSFQTISQPVMQEIKNSLVNWISYPILLFQSFATRLCIGAYCRPQHVLCHDKRPIDGVCGQSRFSTSFWRLHRAFQAHCDKWFSHKGDAAISKVCTGNGLNAHWPDWFVFVREKSVWREHQHTTWYRNQLRDI